MPLRTLLAVASVLVCSLLRAAEESPSPATRTGDILDVWIQSTLERYHVPGASVVVISDGKPLLIKGYGILDAAHPDAKVDADTLFQLASVSKTFTAAATAAVVDAGKLKWNQPVAEILPDFRMRQKFPTQNVTPVDLLTHRAGFKEFFGDLFDHLGYSRDGILSRIRYVKPAYSFRDHPEYSNIGFFLAGETAAHANGSTFEAVVQSALLDPLGMTRTGVATDLAESDANFAKPHAHIDGEPQVLPNNLSPVFVAAGGLASTANDLSRYLRMLLEKGSLDGEKVLSPDAVEEMFTPVIASEIGFAEFPPIDTKTGFFYSPGWGVYYYNGHHILEKGGALDGYRTLVVLVPEAKLGIAVLCNLNLTAFPEAVRAWILQEAFSRPGEADLQAAIFNKAEKLNDLVMQKPEPPKDAEPLRHPLAAFTGTYQSDLFGKWTIGLNKGADAKSYPLVAHAGKTGYPGKIRSWDGNTLAIEWPIFISVPTEIPFNFAAENSPAIGFTFEGYDFLRTP